MTVEFLDYTEGSDRHYHDMLGYKMTEWREGYVRLEMDVQPRHRQRGSFTHGGINDEATQLGENYPFRR